MEYYSPYSPYYWNTTHLLFYDIPLFLLFFSLIYIIVRFGVKIHDSLMTTAIAAFAASVAFFVVRSQTTLYRWFLWNWQLMFGVVVLLMIFFIIFLVVKTST